MHFKSFSVRPRFKLLWSFFLHISFINLVNYSSSHFPVKSSRFCDAKSETMFNYFEHISNIFQTNIMWKFAKRSEVKMQKMKMLSNTFSFILSIPSTLLGASQHFTSRVSNIYAVNIFKISQIVGTFCKTHFWTLAWPSKTLMYCIPGLTVILKNNILSSGFWSELADILKFYQHW